MPNPIVGALRAVSVPRLNPANKPRVESVGFSVGIGAGLLLALVAALFLLGRK